MVMSEIDKVPADKEPLLESSQTNHASETPKETLSLLKYGSLGFLIVQNSSQCAEAHISMAVHHSSASLCHRSPPAYAITCGRWLSRSVLLLRYSRVVPGECSQYIVSCTLLTHFYLLTVAIRPAYASRPLIALDDSRAPMTPRRLLLLFCLRRPSSSSSAWSCSASLRAARAQPWQRLTAIYGSVNATPSRCRYPHCATLCRTTCSSSLPHTSVLSCCSSFTRPRHCRLPSLVWSSSRSSCDATSGAR